MITDTFPVDETPAQVDASLDLVAIKVSLDLIDDVPAKDPRWADVKSSGNDLHELLVLYNLQRFFSVLIRIPGRVNLNSTLSQSLQIQTQLEEKQQALDWFISFLREMGLWNRVSYEA